MALKQWSSNMAKRDRKNWKSIEEKTLLHVYQDGIYGGCFHPTVNWHLRLLASLICWVFIKIRVGHVFTSKFTISKFYCDYDMVKDETEICVLGFLISQKLVL